VTVIDCEVAPGILYTYAAVVISGLLSGPSSSPSASVTTNANNYAFLVDPTAPHTAVGFIMPTNWQPKVHEVGQLYYPLGNPTSIKSTDGTKGIGGTVPIFTSSIIQDQAVRALLQTTNALFFMTPARGAWYVMSDPSIDRIGSVPFAWEATSTPQNIWSFGVVESARP
jgi:hypothetical protein